MWLFHCFTVILIYQTITSFFILVLNLLFTGISSTFRTEPRPKGALKNFAKFTGKQQCQSIFFKKVTGLRTGVFWNFAKFTGKQQCQSTFFNKKLKETLAQVYFVEFCEISKNTFFYRTPLVAASEILSGSNAWKVSKCRVISGSYFPAFGLNTERYFAFLLIQSECGKIRTRNNSEFGHFSRSVRICDWHQYINNFVQNLIWYRDVNPS